jgi:hypothetical protein
MQPPPEGQPPLLDVDGPRVGLTGVRTGGRCIRRDFTVRYTIRDESRLRRVVIFLDGRRIKVTARARFSVRIDLHGLHGGRHTIRAVAHDRAGNRTVVTRSFTTCARPGVTAHLAG